MRLLRLFKRDLAQEAREWVRQEVISEQQAQAICHLYGIDYQNPQGVSTGYQWLISLAYLFIGLSLITLIGANWEEIPRLIRLCGLVLLMAATQTMALRAYFRGAKLSATGLFLLGNLFYGASIILIAQIYHLGEHMPDGVYWWALGSLPFALILVEPWLMLFSLVLASIWFWLDFHLGFFGISYPFFLLASVFVLYRARSNVLLLLFTAIGTVSWFLALLSFIWSSGDKMTLTLGHLPVAAALFALMAASAHWFLRQPNAIAKDYGTLLMLWPLRFGLFTLFVLTFEFPWREALQYDWHHWPSIAVIISVLSIGSAYFGYQSQRLIITLSPFALIAATLAAVIGSSDASYAIHFQVGANIVLVCFGIGLVITGIQQSVSHYFFLGVATLLGVALVRYFDLIGDYVGGALLFLVLAGLMLSAARYWRWRNKAEHQNTVLDNGAHSNGDGSES